jgi:transposase
MQEKKRNRKYDKQFKDEAVRLIHENLLRTWKRKYKEDPAGSFPGKGHLKPQDEEFKKLQKENTSLREDKEILKKALAIFSKHPK